MVAYIEDRSRAFLDNWGERVDQYRGDPRLQLRAIMTYQVERTTMDGYRGCHVINFCAEFPESDHPGCKVTRATKSALRERLLAIAVSLDAVNSQKVRRQPTASGRGRLCDHPDLRQGRGWPRSWAHLRSR